MGIIITNPSSGGAVSDPLTIGSVYATNAIRNNGKEHIVNATKPTTRVDSSALVTGDTWLNLTDNVLCFWNGTYWLGSFLIVDSFSQVSGASGTNPAPQVSISQEAGKSVLIESFTVVYESFGSNPLTDFVLLTLQTYQNRVSGITGVASISTANASTIRTVTALVNQAFTIGTTSGLISTLAIGSVYGGGGGASCYWQGCVAYRRIY